MGAASFTMARNPRRERELFALLPPTALARERERERAREGPQHNVARERARAHYTLPRESVHNTQQRERESECPLHTTERETTDAYALRNDARTTRVKEKYCWRPILNGFHVITNWVAPSPDHKKIPCVEIFPIFSQTHRFDVNFAYDLRTGHSNSCVFHTRRLKKNDLHID